MKNIFLKTSFILFILILLSNSIVYSQENILQNNETTKETTDKEYILTFNKQEEPFEEGDKIEVELKAPKHCKVIMKIEKSEIEENMTEVSDGFYKLSYPIKQGDNVKNSHIIAVCTLPDETEKEIISEDLLSISAFFFKIRLISPENDSKVDQYFDIIGRTKPNCKVFITPSPKIGGVTPFTADNSLGAIETKSDEKGYFKVHCGFPIKVPIIKLKYRYSINAVDDEGKRSLTTLLNVEFKK